MSKKRYRKGNGDPRTITQRHCPAAIITVVTVLVTGGGIERKWYTAKDVMSTVKIYEL